MNTYMILHYGFEKPSPEEMTAWNNWFERIKDRQIERGHFPKGFEISATGTRELAFGKDSITGFTKLQAESLEEAKAIAEDCPFVLATRVYEIMN